MTPEECAKAIAGAVGKVGGEWMFDGVVNERGVELGLDTWAWYHCGRGGVLGNPAPEVLVAAFGFFPPEMQVKAWDKGREVMDPAAITVEYAKACADWGLRRFSDLDSAGRLADLLTRALDTAGVMGIPVFAGWRVILHDYAGSSAPERLALALQTAREQRGGSHLIAVAAAGVEPLQAVMSGRYGEANARFFGWPEPYPDPEVGRDAMKAAEAVTTELVAPAFAVLTADERAELAAGLRAL